GSLRKSRRTSALWPEPVPAEHRIGTSTNRNRGPERLRNLHAGLPRDAERKRRGRDGESHPGAAGIRSRLQGDPGRRTDDDRGVQPRARRMIAIASRICGRALIGAAVVLASSTARAESAPANPLIAQIEAALAPRVPDGMRLKSVTLGCQPPPDASIKEVARGMSRLRSAAFTVELTTPHGIVICSAQAEVERQALVAARDLSAGEEVGASEFRTDWVDAFSTPPDVLVGLDSVQTLMVPLRRGEPVSASLLRKPIVVHQGEMVAVTVTNGGVSLRT